MFLSSANVPLMTSLKTIQHTMNIELSGPLGAQLLMLRNARANILDLEYLKPKENSSLLEFI